MLQAHPLYSAIDETETKCHELRSEPAYIQNKQLSNDRTTPAQARTCFRMVDWRHGGVQAVSNPTDYSTGN